MVVWALLCCAVAGTAATPNARSSGPEAVSYSVVLEREHITEHPDCLKIYRRIF